MHLLHKLCFPCCSPLPLKQLSRFPLPRQFESRELSVWHFAKQISDLYDLHVVTCHVPIYHYVFRRGLTGQTHGSLKILNILTFLVIKSNLTEVGLCSQAFYFTMYKVASPMSLCLQINRRVWLARWVADFKSFNLKQGFV